MTPNDEKLLALLEMVRDIVRAKPIHRAALCDGRGNVSALCFKKPRPINLKRATWTNRDEAVTCEKCIAAMAKKAAP